MRVSIEYRLYSHIIHANAVMAARCGVSADTHARIRVRARRLGLLTGVRVRENSKVEISRVHGTHVSVAYRSYSHIIGACTRTRDGSSMESRQRHASLSIEDYNAQRTALVASWYVVKC